MDSIRASLKDVILVACFLSEHKLDLSIDIVSKKCY